MNAVMIHVAHDGTNDLCRFRPMKIAGTADTPPPRAFHTSVILT